MELYTVYRFLVRIRRLKWLWWSMVLLGVLIYAGYQANIFIDREFRVAEELPFYLVFTTPVLHQWFEVYWIIGPFVLFPIGFFPPLLLSYIFNKYKWLKWTIGG